MIRIESALTRQGLTSRVSVSYGGAKDLAGMLSSRQLSALADEAVRDEVEALIHQHVSKTLQNSATELESDLIQLLARSSQSGRQS